MKSSSNQLKLPINVVKPMLNQQKSFISPVIKSEKEDIEEDIVFLEEKPSSSIKRNAKNFENETNFNNKNKNDDNNTANKVHNEETCEFIFNYSQDIDEFDSDDEYISSSEM